MSMLRTILLFHRWLRLWLCLGLWSASLTGAALAQETSSTAESDLRPGPTVERGMLLGRKLSSAWTPLPFNEPAIAADGELLGRKLGSLWNPLPFHEPAIATDGELLGRKLNSLPMPAPRELRQLASERDMAIRERTALHRRR